MPRLALAREPVIRSLQYLCSLHMVLQRNSSAIRVRQYLLTAPARDRVRASVMNEMICNAISGGRSRRKSRLIRGVMMLHICTSVSTEHEESSSERKTFFAWALRAPNWGRTSLSKASSCRSGQCDFAGLGDGDGAGVGGDVKGTYDVVYEGLWSRVDELQSEVASLEMGPDDVGDKDGDNDEHCAGSLMTLCQLSSYCRRRSARVQG